MTFQEFSKDLNQFSYFYETKNDEIFKITDESQQRIILSRLYYAVLHHFFELHPNIATSNQAGKHETMMRIIQKEHPALSPVFNELKQLREWADYKPHEAAPFVINMKALLHKVKSRIIH
jgi:hypothetical protein